MDLSLFNNEQKQAILLPISPLAVPEILVLAGAGSGKTRVLTYRVAHLISQGVPASQLLAMTFTKKAAKEMQERTQKLVGPGQKVKMSTFHSLCADLLRQYSTASFDIIDDNDQKAILRTLIKEHHELNEIPVKDYLQWLSYKRSKCLDPLARQPNEGESIRLFRMLTERYISAKQRLGAYDFDDLLEKTVEMLKSRSDIARLLQHQWRYILVDEYQDTNSRQAELLSLLRGKQTQFLQVGDEDQLIYSWRGAEISHILSSFKRSQEDRNVLCIPLLTNYRCSANILTLANEVVSVNYKRTGKTLKPHLPKGKPVSITIYSNEHEEADAIARQIKSWYSKGIALKDMAILVRVNRLAKPIERALIDKKLPYHLHNGTALFDKAEVRLLLNLLWFSSRPNETFYLQQVLDVLKFGLGPAALRKLSPQLDNGKSWLDILREMPSKQDKIGPLVESCLRASELLAQGKLGDAAAFILQASPLLDAFKEDERDARADNVSLVIRVIRDYESEALANNQEISLSGFQEQRLLNDELTDNDGGKDVVHIMSVHKAKGLEFTCGAILGMQDGVFPMSMGDDPDRDGEEEIRLAYVAITRFKQELLITRAARRVGFNNISMASILTGPHESHLAAQGVVNVDFN